MAIETELKVRLTLEGFRSVRRKLEQLGSRVETKSQTRHHSRHLSDRLLAGPDHCQFAGFRAAEPLGGDADSQRRGPIHGRLGLDRSGHLAHS